MACENMGENPPVRIERRHGELLGWKWVVAAKHNRIFSDMDSAAANKFPAPVVPAIYSSLEVSVYPTSQHAT